ncbi:MAG: FtsW/RodA/SpoVE family cell cycle protein [Lachnospiraceae bacterium]|nr:FtsW/RodA/SpoVE family cell cycle protein [Lachnospiraceae bacterium]
MAAFQVYYTELSKYAITLLMALYTYEGFAVFRYENEDKRANIYIRQNILMFLIHLACFISIYFEKNEIEYLFFYIFQLILLYATIIIFRTVYPRLNRLLLNNICMLLSIGFVILTRISYIRAQRQFAIAAVSLIIALAVPYIVRKAGFLRKLTWLYASVGMATLAVVLILGQSNLGSRRIFTFAGLAFQPSEIVKILFVLFVAGALYKSTNFFQVFSTMVAAAFHIVILVVSRDLGSALMLFVVYVLMVYLATGKWWYLLVGIVGGSAAAVVAHEVFSHVQVRVQAFRDPWSVIDNQGYQITQSIFSISRGGLFGLGLYQGNPTAIPIVDQDFIFSAIAEELGLIFAICMILICLSCFVMCMNIAVQLNDKFYQLVAFGLGIIYITQVFLTIGGGVKFIPMTGVTLPLVSYGGSSVVTTIMMFSIISGLYMIPGSKSHAFHAHKKKHDIGDPQNLSPKEALNEEEQDKKCRRK